MRLHCKDCGRAKVSSNKRLILSRTDQGEPAKFERVTRGVAKRPNPKNRILYVNGIPQQLSLNYFNCDSCGRPIYPGEKCVAISIWTELMPEPEYWESDYLEVYQ
jgi:hypothetical protein